MLGMCSEYALNINEQVWNMLGILLEYAWNMLGI